MRLAAGRARPGVALALQHHVTPDRLRRVFAGGDIELGTERARSYSPPYRPSSPSIALLRDGKLLFILERHQIENQSAEAIAGALTGAFDKFCAPVVH